ncbi:hypothetical protein EBU94_01595 [bacterium]|nr:hypothetical protein [bacterium]
MKKFIFLTLLGSLITIAILLFAIYPEQIRPYFGNLRNEVVNLFTIPPSAQDENYQDWLNKVSIDPIKRNKLSDRDFNVYDSEGVRFLYAKNWTLEKSKNITLRGEGVNVEIRVSDFRDFASNDALFNELGITATEFSDVVASGSDFSKELPISNTSLKLDTVNQVINDTTVYTFKHTATKIDYENPKLPNEFPNQIVIYINKSKIAIVKMTNTLENFSQNQTQNKAYFEVLIERLELE